VPLARRRLLFNNMILTEGSHPCVALRARYSTGARPARASNM
jgi:hypothetical protein